VEEHTILLRDGRGSANNVDNGDIFAERAGYAIEGGELANTKCRDDGRYALNSSSSIGSIACIELITVTHPFQAAGFEGIELNSCQC
jgi:hypothetical protein